MCFCQSIFNIIYFCILRYFCTNLNKYFEEFSKYFVIILTSNAIMITLLDTSPRSSSPPAEAAKSLPNVTLDPNHLLANIPASSLSKDRIQCPVCKNHVVRRVYRRHFETMHCVQPPVIK